MNAPKTKAKEAVRQDEVEAQILARRESRIRLLLADARALHLVQESGHFRIRRCSSIREYGERILSLSARETHETLLIARSMRHFRELEAMLLDGRTTPEAASALAALAAHPEVIRPEDDWLLWAERESAKSLRKRIAKRLREEKVPRPPRQVTVHLGEQGSQDLDDAQVLASQSAREPVSVSETVEVVLREFVKKHNPLERTPGQRRLPLTGNRMTRTIPAEEKRKILARANRKCRYPFCDNSNSRAHLARAPGQGTRPGRDARPHHGMQGRGEVLNKGTTDTPKFVDDQGVPLDRRFLTLLRGASRGHPVGGHALREAPDAAASRREAEAPDASRGPPGGETGPPT